MEFDHENVRLAIEEDRLSRLPDELIHHIFSFMDTKYVVQTCMLSSRWKHLWKSMPCLKFDGRDFVSLAKFGKFVNRVLSNRNHEIEVTSINLDFYGANSQFFVRKIGNYVVSHNVQELTVANWQSKGLQEYPSSLFSSPTLKHFSLRSWFNAPGTVPKTPWNFPALTSLHLSSISLYICDNTHNPIDLFSKCVNLKNLTLKGFFVKNVEVFDIITPRLSNLTLIKFKHLGTFNLVAPQLENLTVNDCSIENMIAPPGLLTLFYRGCFPQQFSKDGFHSLKKATISLSFEYFKLYGEEDARKTINMLQELYNVGFLTLNVDVVECLSDYPDLVSKHPSPFSNLISLDIDNPFMRTKYNVEISSEVRNFLLGNSPSAAFIKPPPPILFRESPT